MNNLFYPAIFHAAEEGGYWVTFPDFPECVTEGDTTEGTYKMAVDALGLAITSRKEEGEEIPTASSISELSETDGTIVLIGFNMLEYQKRHNSRAVKKTLSIPEWMNTEAVAMGINFSQVLQEALMQKINF